MTADIPAIEARAAAATPGPWRMDADIADLLNEWVDHPDDRIEYRTVEGITNLETGDGWYFNEADATFIAHARDDIPALLADLAAAQVLVTAALRWKHERGSLRALQDGATPTSDFERAITAYEETHR